MPNRSSKKRPSDINQLAASIVQDATAEPDAPADSLTESGPPKPPAKDPAAVSLGRRGGLKGGKARAEKLPAERRVEIARRAAQSRWSKRD